ncbi:MAG: NAD(P)H-dependent oxidoreductase [Myxococcota bacterium]
MNVFAMAGSLRAESLNKKLIAAAKTGAESLGATVDLADLGEFTLPLYNADVQSTNGHPAAAVALGERIAGADAVLLASPEYNYSIPGVLKNAIDWLSRQRPNPFSTGKPTLLLATSPGPVGGARGLWQLRIPLEGIGAYVHPQMYSLPFGDKALTDNGRLAEEDKQERLTALIGEFLRAADALNGRHR